MVGYHAGTAPIPQGKPLVLREDTDLLYTERFNQIY